MTNALELILNNGNVLTQEETEKREKSLMDSMKNVKMRVNAEKEEAYITISLKGFDWERLIKAESLEAYERTSGSTTDKKTGLPKEPNLRIATSMGSKRVTHPKYKHVGFTINFYGIGEDIVNGRKTYRDELQKERERLEALKALENAKKAAQNVPVPTVGAQPQATENASTPSGGTPKDIQILKGILEANPAYFGQLSPEQQARVMEYLI